MGEGQVLSLSVQRTGQGGGGNSGSAGSSGGRTWTVLPPQVQQWMRVKINGRTIQLLVFDGDFTGTVAQQFCRSVAGDTSAAVASCVEIVWGHAVPKPTFSRGDLPHLHVCLPRLTPRSPLPLPLPSPPKPSLPQQQHSFAVATRDAIKRFCEAALGPGIAAAEHGAGRFACAVELQNSVAAAVPALARGVMRHTNVLELPAAASCQGPVIPDMRAGKQAVAWHFVVARCKERLDWLPPIVGALPSGGGGGGGGHYVYVYNKCGVSVHEEDRRHLLAAAPSVTLLEAAVHNVGFESDVYLRHLLADWTVGGDSAGGDGDGNSNSAQQQEEEVLYVMLQGNPFDHVDGDVQQQRKRLRAGPPPASERGWLTSVATFIGTRRSDVLESTPPS